MKQPGERGWTYVWIVTAPKYVPMGIVSAASFHLCNPRNTICWLVSEDAAKEFNRLVPAWLAQFVEVRALATAGEEPVAASRRLRLSVAERVQGDIVAVDADILCLRPIDVAVGDVAVMGACPNRDNDGNWNNDPEMRASRQLFTSAGWTWPCAPDRPYLNAGLVFYRDVARSREFGERWRKNRDEFLAKTGKYYDQPAFNKTAVETGYVEVLDEKLNAPVNVLPRTAKGAVCYHYYVSGAAEALFGTTTMGFLANKLTTNGSLDRDEMSALLSKRKPFVGWGAIDKQYLLAGQWRNYLERKIRVGWDGVKRRLEAET